MRSKVSCTVLKASRASDRSAESNPTQHVPYYRISCQVPGPFPHQIEVTLDEGIIWIVAHEAFHFLRRTGQVPGRNTEIEADRFADEQLSRLRTLRKRWTCRS